jgi:two-component system OmpR family sensor kinase
MRFSAIPRSLTSRLVVTAVALVALVSVLVAVATTLVMNQYLTQRLDEQVHGVVERAANPDGHRPGGPDPTDGDDGAFGRGPQSPDTLVADVSPAHTQSGGILGASYSESTPLSDRALNQLDDVPVDGHAHTVSVAGVGDYRVQASKDSSGRVLVGGLPLKEIHRTVQSLLLRSSLLAVTGILLAGLVGLFLVRRQLRPLREVAATAYDVTAMPLGSGGQTIETRVPDQYTDPFTEVGQVGSALNTLLDHVDSALESRHQSEQQVRQFVADASHELRTPLSTIHGYAELSRRTPEDAEMLSQAMGKVETEATRMSALVGDMLLLARLDSGRPLEREEVDLTRLLLEAVADAKVVAPDHVWRLDLPEEPVTVVGDEQRLHQVVTNLINNARRHTPAGTTVTVGARPRPAEGEQVQIKVHDDGPGIPAALQGRVFERFTRGDTSRTRSSGGAGLGLSLVQAITEAHGGTASISSAPGDTTFTISLP